MGTELVITVYGSFIKSTLHPMSPILPHRIHSSCQQHGSGAEDTCKQAQRLEFNSWDPRVGMHQLSQIVL